MTSNVSNYCCCPISYGLWEVSPHSHQVLSWDRSFGLDQIPLFPSTFWLRWRYSTNLPLAASSQEPDLIPMSLGFVSMSIWNYHHTALICLCLQSTLNSYQAFLERDQCSFWTWCAILLASLKISFMARPVITVWVFSFPTFFAFCVTRTCCGPRHHSYVQWNRAFSWLKK